MTLLKQLVQLGRNDFANIEEELPKIQRMLESGEVSANETNSLGSTPLNYLITKVHNQEKSLPLFKLLIEHGADVNKIDWRNEAHNFSLLYSSIKETWEGSGRVYLFLHARALIEAGADVNASDSDGRTPLHQITALCSISRGNNYGKECFEIARKLLEAGANPNIKEKGHYQTPLSYLFDDVSRGIDKTELTESYIMLLLQHGADPRIGDVNFGDSSIYTAKEFCRDKKWEAIFEAQIERLDLEKGIKTSSARQSPKKQKI